MDDIITHMCWYPLSLRRTFKDGKLSRRGGMWYGVPLECGLGYSNIISQWSLSLWPHIHGDTTIGWKCSKIQKLSSSVVKLSNCFLLYLEWYPVASFGPLRAAGCTMAPSGPDLWNKYPCVTPTCLVTGFWPVWYSQHDGMPHLCFIWK